MALLSPTVGSGDRVQRGMRILTWMIASGVNGISSSLFRDP
jgi:hypothetical protein